ncbi:DUF4157 domain-containing protein [Methylobacter sp. BlB1]|uniref:eCIS core domain-containing protein n=1 Tax=Methylobacter sp. BlB1 TaxID=2785914 RepID=UPI001894FB6A|nr:DUF4157 domain-containing protein [Methylobacter sp. BlB1]MBF6648873.1 DUF4157 domain-containing protein [Methylobacter sp. BlB1]
MKSSSEKSTGTVSKTATQTPSQPFFAKAGGGDFFAPASQSFTASVQMKMAVNKPGDKFEQEADKMADKVMRMPAPAPTKEEKLQRQPEEKLQKKEEEKIQKAVMPEEKIQKAAMPEEKLQKKEDEKIQKAPAAEEKLQRKDSAGAPTVNSGIQSAIQNKTTGGQPLPSDIRDYMEPRFNADFSNVRVHSDPESASLSSQLSARAFTHKNHIFFSRGQYQPGGSEGKQLLAHELTHTIQQGHAIQRSPQVSTTATPPPVQRGLLDSLNPLEYLIDKALGFIADNAAAIPGFTMLTVVIGYNPITRASVDRSAGNILKGAIEMIPGGAYITQALANHGVFDKVSVFAAQQFAALSDIGSNIWQDIKQFVKKFSVTDLADPGAVWERGKKIVTAPIGQIKAFAVGLKDGMITLVKDAILKPIAAFAKANAPNGYDLLCAVLGKDPISGEPVPQTAENLIGPFMKLIGQEEVWQNMQKANAIARAWAWFQNALGTVKGFVQQVPALFIAAFQALEFIDIVLLPNAFNKLKSVFGGFAGKFISWASNAVWNLLEIIFDSVKPGAMAYVKRAGAALKSILKNPLPFVGNLAKAGKAGFETFADNIGTHLKAGLIDWLTGSLNGVYIPKALSLPELGKFVLSVLGITWPKIRAKIVKAMGPKGEAIMSGIENGVEKGYEIIVKLKNGGPVAIWEMIQEKLADLKDTVVSGIIGFVTDAIITKAVPKLVAMFIPGAGFISAIVSIYDIVMVIVAKMSKIAAVVAGFVNSIMQIAAGNIRSAAIMVSNALAGMLSLAISLLAGLVGLGKVTDKINGVVSKARGGVNKAIDAALAWVVKKAKDLFGKLFGKKDKKDERTEEQKQKAVDDASKEVVAYTKSTKVNFIKLRLKLSSVKSKYQLTAIKAEKVSKGKYQVEAVINPKKGTEVEIDDDPNGLPPGAKEPVVKYTAESHSGNKRTYCKDADVKVWFWNEGKGSWQVTSDDKKLMEAEKAATKWLADNNSTFISLVKDDKLLSNSGFDQLGIQVNPTNNQDEVVIGDTKGAFGKSPIYFTYKGVKAGRDNPFSATTTNLPANILAQRKDNPAALVKRLDAALKAGNVTVIYFVAGKAKISDATLTKVKGMITKNLIKLLTGLPYSLTPEDARNIVKDIPKPIVQNI